MSPKSGARESLEHVHLHRNGAIVSNDCLCRQCVMDQTGTSQGGGKQHGVDERVGTKKDM